MARCIHNIDAIVLPADGRILGQDGDTAFALLIIGIHDPLKLLPAGFQGSRLLQQFVHQSRLAMVDMGNDGDISNILNQVRIPVGAWPAPLGRHSKKRRVYTTQGDRTMSVGRCRGAGAARLPAQLEHGDIAETVILKMSGVQAAHHAAIAVEQ